MKSFKVLVLLSALLGITTVYVANIAAADGGPVEYTFNPTNGNGDQGVDIDLNVNHDEGGGDDLTSEKSNPRRDSGTSSPGNFTGGGAGSGRVTQIAYTNAPGSNVIVDAGTLAESQAQIDTLRAAFAELQGVNRNQQATIENLTQENKSLVGRLKAQTQVNDTILADVESIENENARLKADEIATKKAHGEALKTAENKAAEDVERVQAELKSMRAENARLKQASATTAAELLKVRATIESLESQKDLTDQEKERLAELEDIDVKLKEEQVRTAQLQEQLRSQEATSNKVIAELQAQHGVRVAELEEQVASVKGVIADLNKELGKLKADLSDKTGTSLGEEKKAPDAQQKEEPNAQQITTENKRIKELEAKIQQLEAANKVSQAQLAEAQRVVTVKPEPGSVKPAPVTELAQSQTVEFPNKTGAQLLDLFNAPSGVFAKALMDSGLVDRVIFSDKGGKGIVIFGPKEGQTKVKFTNEINNYAVKLLDQCTEILTKNKAKLIQPERLKAAQNVIDLIELFEKNGYSMTEETKQRIVILKALPNAAQLVIPESLEVLSVVSGDGSHVSGKGKPVGDATQTAGKPVKKGLWQRVKEFLREHLSSNYKTLNTNYVTEYQNSNFGKGHSNLDNLQSQIDELMVGKTPAESALVLKKGRSLATLQRTTVIHSVMDAVLKDRLSAKFTPIDQKTLFTQIMASPEIQDLLKQQGEFREALWPNRAKEIEYLMEPHYYSQESLEAFNKKLKNYAQIKVTLGLDDADVKVRVKEMLSQYAKMVSSSFVKATQAMPNPVLESGPPEDDDEYSGN